MKVVKILGGLGNQMLQYAFALKLKHLYPKESIYIDVDSFEGYKWHKYELGFVFDVKIPQATKYHRWYVTRHIPFVKKGYFSGKTNLYEEKWEDLCKYDSNALTVRGDCYYWGYWFNAKYFEDIEDKVREVFSFNNCLSIANLALENDIKNSNSVSIHVRRGNYLLYDIYKGICEKDYYQKAISYMKSRIENPHFFIFSNDRKWCEDNIIDFVDNYTFSDNNDDQTNYVDMQLMSLCKHNIIAHSSFSWWSAWLNRNPDKIVVAPFKWLNDEKVKNKPQLSDWILL